MTNLFYFFKKRANFSTCLKKKYDQLVDLQIRYLTVSRWWGSNVRQRQKATLLGRLERELKEFFENYYEPKENNKVCYQTAIEDIQHILNEVKTCKATAGKNKYKLLRKKNKSKFNRFGKIINEIEDLLEKRLTHMCKLKDYHDINSNQMKIC